MNKNPQKTILCYGDSNTWGYVPNKANNTTMHIERYAKNQRWTGLLQEYLGNDYCVVEEALNGRTTNLDYIFYPDRNGKTYLPPCLYSHAPIDLVVLLLGGNDLKFCFNRSAEDICNGLAELIDIIQTSKYGNGMQFSPEILIISQPIPLPLCENFIDSDNIKVFKGAINKAHAMVALYSDLARDKKCLFLDISNNVKPSNIDGMHLDEKNHRILAELVSKKINRLFSSK